MLRLTRALLISASCLALCFGSVPAHAKTMHHRHHAVHHVAKGSDIIRIAQRHLSNLGYYSGKVDGVMGSRTRAALKKFQTEHSLKKDGLLGPKTRSALDLADHPALKDADQHTMPMQESVALPTAPLNAPVNPDYDLSFRYASKSLPNRFAHLDVSETGAGAGKHYVVALNGQPILFAEKQSSVIAISPVYQLPTEDAVVFTTYVEGDAVCPYRNNVLVLTASADQIMNIPNCTRAFEGRVTQGSLYLTFSEREDASALGGTFRLEGMSLEKL